MISQSSTHSQVAGSILGMQMVSHFPQAIQLVSIRAGISVSELCMPLDGCRNEGGIFAGSVTSNFQFFFSMDSRGALL